MTRISRLSVSILAAVFLTLAGLPRANATSIGAQICSAAPVPGFACAPLNVIDQGFRANGVVLGANTGFIGAFAFNDAILSFVGTMTTANIGGRWIYLDVTGTITTKAGAPGANLGGGFFLNIDAAQGYLTVGGAGTFFDFLSGTCNAAAGGDTLDGNLFANAVPVGVLAPGCPAGGGAFAAFNGPTGIAVTPFVRLDGAAAIDFVPPVGIAETINLPFAENFPDPSLPGLLLPPACSSTVMSDCVTYSSGTLTPEPASAVLLLLGLPLVWVGRRKLGLAKRNG